MLSSLVGTQLRHRSRCVGLTRQGGVMKDKGGDEEQGVVMKDHRGPGDADAVWALGHQGAVDAHLCADPEVWRRLTGRTCLG